jgi:Sodium/hydrogen exchanger family
MHNVDLILTLTGGLAAALILGYITQRLGLSPIVGYILGGFAVGPHTPGFVANFEMANQLAEVGVILLMFGVGCNVISMSCSRYAASPFPAPSARVSWPLFWAFERRRHARDRRDYSPSAGVEPEDSGAGSRQLSA